MNAKTSTGLQQNVEIFQGRPISLPGRPDAAGNIVPYKIEYKVIGTPEKTIKINYMPGPDRRQNVPHNHPWTEIRCWVMSGGYKEEVYWLDTNGVVQHETRMHYEDDVNTVRHEEFHVITNVKPMTITAMKCGHIVGNGKQWGYLDTKTGEYFHNSHPDYADPSFVDQMKRLNPWM